MWAWQATFAEKIAHELMATPFRALATTTVQNHLNNGKQDQTLYFLQGTSTNETFHEKLRVSMYNVCMYECMQV
tara:strand:+ start:353 stop:574 length:222 start_codon:yes stop_codon:yes gene_type:complete